MLSPVSLSILAAHVFVLGVSAHLDLLDGLPSCWLDCLSNTDDGCDSAKCICDASQSDSYLTSAVECARSECEADGSALDLLFLGPLDLYCSATGEEIPEDTMSSAYACATATAASPSLTTRKVERSTETSEHKTTQGGGSGSTSTLESESTATSAPSSAAASPSQAPETSAPAPTQAQGASSSSASASPTQGTSNSNGNGSPFENMQAGASQWGFSSLVVAMSVIAGLFLRL
ncbi:hypothetical protein BU26DRAFT_526007 [Trematosphaeria pertusa]|uniref:Extracellular membrane protein CFEM domain-containing protein n=1 Tax=Trematosphaeria pertusa TaxID=390896 RepID=A0A6A6HSP2_9PLEO|nr:uncharacterized protein BU26DRAFT_526007 [Trematosphaeria pertusa]KAF2240543.1 hypothetical protein BU26DRAFT_526007 [Trematosphaeria pertusa]